MEHLDPRPGLRLNLSNEREGASAGQIVIKKAATAVVAVADLAGAPRAGTRAVQIPATSRQTCLHIQPLPNLYPTFAPAPANTLYFASAAPLWARRWPAPCWSVHVFRASRSPHVRSQRLGRRLSDRDSR